MIAKNSNGEHLNDVDIHVVTSDEGISIEVSALTSYANGGGGAPIVEVGRSLLTITSGPTGSDDQDEHYSSADLANIADWGFTDQAEDLILHAAAAGHRMVESAAA